MKVVFLTECGLNIGMGHIVRCFALSEAFKIKGIESHFIVYGDDSFISITKDVSYNLIDWKNDNNILNKYIDVDDIVIVDSYLANEDFYERMSYRYKNIVYIDDNYRINYPEGIIVNGNSYAKKKYYGKRKLCLVGTKYVALRKEYWDQETKIINKKVKNILIMFGGTDVRHLSDRVIKAIKGKYSDLNIVSLSKKLNSDEIKRYMLCSDVVISAGGQSLYEIINVGLPCVCIGVADNQINNVNRLESIKVIKYAGFWNEKNIINSTLNCFEKILRYRIRTNMSKRQIKVVDGKGSSRIVKKILFSYINDNLKINRAAEKDMMNIFELSNDPEVRRNSFNSNLIKISEHKQWYGELLKNTNNIFLLGYLNDTLVAQVRFKLDKEIANISISVSGRYRGLGLGQFMLDKCLRYLKNKNFKIKSIEAKIKNNNLTSINFFERNRFILKKSYNNVLTYVRDNKI